MTSQFWYPLSSIAQTCTLLFKSTAAESKPALKWRLQMKIYEDHTYTGKASRDQRGRGFKIARMADLGEWLKIAKLGDPGGALKLRSRGYFWKVSFSCINSWQNRWYLARNTQNFARACLCSAWACSCLLVNGRVGAMFRLENPVLGSLISLYQFFTTFVVSGAKCQQSQKLEIWTLGIIKSYFWKVSFSFINYSQNWWYLARTTTNRKIPKICSCLLVLSLCMLVRACACSWMTVLGPCSDSKIQFWEGVISL